LGRSGQRPEFSQATGMALVLCILGKFLWVACHCFPRFSDIPTFHHQVPPRPPQRERPQRRKWELWVRMLSGNFAEMTTSTAFRDLLHGTDGFTSPPKEGVLRIFSTLKIHAINNKILISYNTLTSECELQWRMQNGPVSCPVAVMTAKVCQDESSHARQNLWFWPWLMQWHSRYLDM